MNATKLSNILEAVGEAYEACRLDYDAATMYGIAGLVAAGDASHDDVIGAVMQAHRRLDPLVQLKLADRITARLAEPTGRSAPQRRSSDAEMIYSTPGRILSVR